jgi:signal recognition particle GTPase
MGIEEQDFLSYEWLINKDTEKFFENKKNLEDILDIIKQNLIGEDVDEKVLNAFIKALESSKNIEDFIGFIYSFEDINKSLKKWFKYIIIDKIKSFNKEMSKSSEVFLQSVSKTISY